ncbi:MAG: hypothetical protein KGL11_12220, partial [Alphaproteobacteria bacterium]|nr:hypothetical protein [Alphaproteobacteria bacterium]
QVLEASANNVRHNDEWAKTRPPTRKQLGSIRVLAAALDEPIAADGKGHRLAREVCPEILQVVSGGDFTRLESAVFTFAKSLLSGRQRRSPDQ